MFALGGRNFILGKIGIARAGLPVELEKLDGNVRRGIALVIASNDGKLGKTPSSTYVPPAIVIAGAQQRTKLLEDGVVRSWAYVQDGILASAITDTIHPSELMARLYGGIMAREYGKLDVRGSALPAPHIKEIYPFENWLSYRFKGQQFKQAYELDQEMRSVVLCGSAVPVFDRLNASSIEVRESMPRAYTGLQYCTAPVKANLQSFTTGGATSELVTQTVRRWENIYNAAQRYIDYMKSGVGTTGGFRNSLPPAFAPVAISPQGRVGGVQMLAAMGIEPFHFAVWSLQHGFSGRQEKAQGVSIHG